MVGDAEFALELSDVVAETGGVDGVAFGGLEAGDSAAEVVVESDERGFPDVLADHGSESDGEVFFASDLKAEFGVADTVGAAGSGFHFAVDGFRAGDFADEVVVAIAPAVLVADDEAVIVGVGIPEGAEESEGEFGEDDAFVLVLFDESVVARGGDDFGADLGESDSCGIAARYPALPVKLDVDGIGGEGERIFLFAIPGFGAEFEASFGRECGPEFFEIRGGERDGAERAQDAAFERSNSFLRLMDLLGIGDVERGGGAAGSLVEDAIEGIPDIVG